MDSTETAGQVPAPTAPAAHVTADAPAGAGAHETPRQAVHSVLDHTQSVGDALASLATFIPGFAGYKAAEERRIADKQLRAVIGERLTKIKGRLDDLNGTLSRTGSLDGLALIDQSGRRLERLIDRMRFADYGYAAIFDRVSLGEPELSRLYQYDTGIMQELGAFDDAVSAAEQAAPDQERLRIALGKLDALTAEFDRRFEARKHLFDGLPTP
ncbi:MAG: hypothetical protein DLM53_04450 [Candidatus Eremiobacter antarcticus]|nr:hypothetical protein [Candidatus Eremiobacteraeota bacterium]MBC5807969.1 hypothetical protein [Candidatus Eremiobacteraeota bacterium]PZR62669.1 MAG: hypothetical protein DLM53_04450 [Candidatus Eremiobacter sp. RRmetagenome_bin22]